jgi:hypothetical protein
MGSIRESTSGDCQQPGCESSQVVPVAAACFPGFLEGALGEVLCHLVVSHSEAEVVVHSGNLVSVYFFPVEVDSVFILPAKEECTCQGYSQYTQDSRK